MALLATLGSGCGKRGPTSDGTVPDEPEPTAAIDLAAWEHAEIAVPADAGAADEAAQDAAAAKAASAPAGAALAAKPAAAEGSGTTAIRNWELQLPRGYTLDTYAYILDYFGFELGVIQPRGRIRYVYGLSKHRPDTRWGSADTEHRFYFSWSRGDLSEADQELLSRAKIDAQGLVVVKFFRPEVEALLAELEAGYAAERAPRVARTRFGIRRVRDGYEFFIVEQTCLLTR